jgi:hypothetical protein
MGCPCEATPQLPQGLPRDSSNGRRKFSVCRCVRDYFSYPTLTPFRLCAQPEPRGERGPGWLATMRHGTDCHAAGERNGREYAWLVVCSTSNDSSHDAVKSRNVGVFPRGQPIRGEQIKHYPCYCLLSDVPSRKAKTTTMPDLVLGLFLNHYEFGLLIFKVTTSVTVASWPSSSQMTSYSLTRMRVPLWVRMVGKWCRPFYRCSLIIPSISMLSPGW